MSNNVKNLVVRFLEDGVDAVARKFRGVDSALDDVNQGLSSAQEGSAGLGKEAAKGAEEGERALRRLGIQSEESAKRQIAAIEEQNRRVQQSTTATEAEKVAAARAAAERIARVKARTARDVESNFERMARSAIASFDRLGQRAQRISRGIGVAFAAVGAAGTAVAGIVFRNVQLSAQFADELIKLSRETGIAANRLAAFGFAAEDSGVSASEFGTAIRNLRQGLNDNAELLRSYGVRLRDNNGVLLETGEIFRNVIGALNQIDDEFERAGLAAEVFGNRIGPRLASLIEGGTELLDQYSKDLDRLGFDFEAAGRDAEAFNDNLAAIFRRLRLLRTIAAAPFLQPFAEVLDRIGVLIDGNSEKIKEFASVLAGGVLSLFEDFVAILDGRDGDVQNSWILQLRDTAVTFGNVLMTVIVPALQTALSALQNMPSWLSKAVVLLALFGGALGPILIIVGRIAAGVFSVVKWLRKAGPLFAGLLRTGRALALAAGIFAGTIGGVPLAIGAAVVAVGALAFAFRDQLTAAFRSAFDFFRNGIANIAQSVRNFFSGIGNSLSGASANLSVAPTASLAAVPAVAPAGGGGFPDLGRVTFTGPNGESVSGFMQPDAYDEFLRRQRQLDRASGGPQGRFAG